MESQAMLTEVAVRELPCEEDFVSYPVDEGCVCSLGIE